MAMKKPMKKFKRYDEGGEVAEASAKQRGLDISNKEEPVGFFERLRMGNIDQPGSEAYNRFGAGRGRSAQSDSSTPVSVDESMPVARPSMKPNPMIAAGEEQGKRQPSGDASVAEDYSGPRTKPIVTTPVKPSAPKKTPESMPVPRLMDRTKPVGTGNQRGPTAEELAEYASQKNKKPSAAAKMDLPGMKEKAKAALDEDPTALIGGGAGAAAALLARSKLGKMFKGAKKAASKSPYLKEIGMEPKKLTRKASDVTDVVAKKHGGKVQKYASGGTVGSASKRADGIATKGKTRCKIC
jgi:gas vesicle protein